MLIQSKLDLNLVLNLTKNQLRQSNTFWPAIAKLNKCLFPFVTKTRWLIVDPETRLKHQKLMEKTLILDFLELALSIVISSIAEVFFFKFPEIENGVLLNTQRKWIFLFMFTYRYVHIHFMLVFLSYLKS